MLKEEINEVIKDIHESWGTYIKIPEIKGELVKCLTMLSHKDSANVVPKPADIMRAFRMPVGKVRVVVIGQDPYFNEGQANGQAFAVNKGFAVPPSLNNIYKALVNTGCIQKAPKHGDLSAWIDQGILMLNSKLTTELGTPNHADHACWEAFTDRMIGELVKDIINDNRRTVFMLWGGFARNKRAIIESTCYSLTGVTANDYIKVLARTHPSPTADNHLPKDKRFAFCDHFVKAKEYIGHINWEIDALNHESNESIESNDSNDSNNAIDKLRAISSLGVRQIHGRYQPLKEIETAHLDFNGASTDVNMEHINECIVAFTDGACSGNGKKHAKAGAGLYFGSGPLIGRSYSKSIDTVKTIEGTVKPSNNRGELEAIRMAFEEIINEGQAAIKMPIMIVSDSKYCIGTITEWYPSRVRKGTHSELKNLDMVSSILNIIMEFNLKVMFKLVRASHDIPEDDRSAYTRFIYVGNVKADALAVNAK